MKRTRQIFPLTPLHEARNSFPTTSQFPQVCKTIGYSIFMLALVGATDGPKQPPILRVKSCSAAPRAQRLPRRILDHRAQALRRRGCQTPSRAGTHTTAPTERPWRCLHPLQRPARHLRRQGRQPLHRRGRGTPRTCPQCPRRGRQALLPRVLHPARGRPPPTSTSDPHPRTTADKPSTRSRSGRTDETGKAPTEKDVLEARRKAEEAAADLRRQGGGLLLPRPEHEHGDRRVFGERDIQNAFSLGKTS